MFLLSFGIYVRFVNLADPLGTARTRAGLSSEELSHLRQILGLDKAMFLRYFAWAGHFLRGDWGASLFSNRPVAPDIRDALTNSVVLGFSAILLSFLAGGALGLFSAVKQYSLLDRLVTAGTLLGLSIPGFWLALLLQMLFGILLPRWLHLSGPIFPVAGRSRPGVLGFNVADRLWHLVLPVSVLSAHFTAIFMRYTRASVLEVLRTDYIRTAEAKGLTVARVLLKHALPNALLPVVTELALDIGAVAGGFMLVEFVFQWPGMGLFFIVALRYRDWPQVLPWLMVTTAFIVALNLLADIVYAVLDPRIRYRR